MSGGLEYGLLLMAHLSEPVLFDKGVESCAILLTSLEKETVSILGQRVVLLSLTGKESLSAQV